MNTKQIQIKDYNYPLPDHRIAKYPLAERDASKLLIYDKGTVGEDTFRSLPSYLPEGTLMVFNNTRVIQARLHFHKETGALIEVFLLEPAQPVEYQENFATSGACSWYCMVGNLKKWKTGVLRRTIEVEGYGAVEITATRGEVHGTSHRIDFAWTQGVSWAAVLDAMGELPIPPYLGRDTEESDLKTYQTVYSKVKGSVAAPTAGLHFTPRVLADIDARGIDREEVTLHVGAGTFKPVKSKEIGDHDMHTEHIAVRRQTIEKLIQHGGHATCVGTTSVRTLESLWYMARKAEHLMEEGKDTGDAEEELHVGQWEPYEGDVPCSEGDLQPLLTYMLKHQLDILHSSTQIIIAPGYKYHIVERMITNFHQPQSTLLLLVSAFLEQPRDVADLATRHAEGHTTSHTGTAWRTIYDYALSHDFRFLSYGDSSLLIP